jgi:hypothetical protein
LQLSDRNPQLVFGAIGGPAKSCYRGSKLSHISMNTVLSTCFQE